MKIDGADYQIKPGEKIKLKSISTGCGEIEKDDLSARLDQVKQETFDLQQLLYADNRYSLLVIFQGMDTSGKDGAIKNVFSGLNPLGCQVFSFKVPTATELDHDFMWRTTLCLPERGRIGIFNRSYYEEVTTVRVHPEFLQRARLGDELVENREQLWEERLADIRNFEDYLFRNGTKVVKFFLHISKDEQRRRLLKRLNREDKQWKLDLSDVSERALWDEYWKVYSKAISATSTERAPWFVIPNDTKRIGQLIVASILREQLSRLKLRSPKASTELGRIREELLKAP